MVAAVLVTMVATGLVVVSAQYALHSLSTTSVDRKQVQAVGAAEGGLDVAISDLQSATLPCSVSSPASGQTGALSAAPTSESYSANIYYYDSSGNSLESNCSGGSSPPSGTLSTSVTPATAVVKSTGNTSASTTYGTRTMQAEVALSPVSGAATGDAIFSNGQLSISQTYNIYSQTGQSNNAIVYSNSDWSCSQAGTINGSLYVQGKVSNSQTCSVTGQVWSTGNFTSNHSGSTYGSVKSSSGTITLSSGVTVTGNAYAAGSISGGTVNGTSYQNQTGLSAPPSQSFPTWNFDQNAWTAAGYTSFLTASTCSALTTDLTNMASNAPPTVIQTSCQFNGPATYNLSNNLAIFDTGGASISNPTTFQSSNGTSHNFYFIVPTGSNTVGSCNANINASQTLTIGTSSNPLQAFIYTPCDMSLSQTSEIYGQLYAGGKLSVSQSFSIQYAQAPWPGATGTGGTTSSYTVNVAYEREVQ